MNTRTLARRLLPLSLSALLAACATAPPQHPAPAVPPPEPSPIAPAPAAASSSGAVVAATPETAGNVWDRLRGSFQMADCDASPAVLSWARRYTRDPQRFEAALRDALPKLTYVQQVAAEHDVAGEFVLLPWIESGFRPIPARRGRPAGMWQIMPATAAAMGLHVDSRYDARLDVQASADAVMKLLRTYYDEFHDWRVADYAYNAGEFKARQLMQRHGMPPPSPVIPHWPVHDITREHLTRLLAVACVVRQPGRFAVTLPTLQPSQHLVPVPLPHSMPLARAADKAGMQLEALKNLNAAFRTNIADAGAAPYLMMPLGHAQQFHDALLAQASSADDTLGSDPAGHLESGGNGASEQSAAARTHRVVAGESLWQLARRYAVSVKELERWNHLHGPQIKPGQVLKVRAPM
ncbi:MAG: lytic transglycosylase domain-containing protein [Rhodanobacter sp.]